MDLNLNSESADGYAFTSMNFTFQLEVSFT